MPDIIEESEEGELRRRVVERRADRAASMQALARARVAVGDNNNNNDINAVDAAANNYENNNNNNNHDNVNGEDADEISGISRQIARLCSVDVRPMFHRLGVVRKFDIRYIREKDLEGIPRVSQIQKRKIWAVMKYVATTDHPLTATTTLREIAGALNQSKKSNKDNKASAPATAAFVPLAHSSKLDAFDGCHTNWLLWKNKTYHSLSQTCLSFLLPKGGGGDRFAKNNVGKDQLLFHMLAEALVGGSAKHLIAKCQQSLVASGTVLNNNDDAASGAAAGNDNSITSNQGKSGRFLWQLLIKEYSEGPNSFWIISQARQTLQKLYLVNPLLKANGDKLQEDEFIYFNARDYVQRFRAAKGTLEEYQQSLPDNFLASTFVEHVYDSHFEFTKKQLLHKISLEQTSLESCINELLMADHIVRARQRQPIDTSHGNDGPASCRKRSMQEANKQEEEGAKRPRLEDGAIGMDKKEPDEASSA